jgi:peptide deformylase
MIDLKKLATRQALFINSKTNIIRTGTSDLKIIEPHNKKSRDVKEADLERVLKDAQEMVDICFTGAGKYPSAYAVAHPQVNADDPLRFFVLASGVMVINPVMLRHTNSSVDSQEGCLSYGEEAQIIVKRYHKSEFEFLTIVKDENDKPLFSEPQLVKLSGHESFIFQHELDHLNAKYIYEK